MRCPSCDQPQSPEAVFCPACGEPLRASARAGEAARDPRPQGERRPATAVFSDLSGYTALNEALDPEDVAAVMNQIKDAASRLIEAHGGTVNQFVGDQVMALFGVPTAHDDDPIRAVQAALALHGFVREFAAQLEERTGQRLALHTAVNTGLIVAQRRDQRDGVFAVTGDAINTGARLADAAGPDEVLVGPDTFRAIAPYFDTEPVGDIALRGKAAPVEAHRVHGIVARTRFEAARLRGLSAMVGREAELVRLRECLARLVRGRGGLVTVSGEPGVGKSRLCHEFERLSRQAGVRVLRARCDAFGTVAPYAPFAQLLRERLELKVDAPHEEVVAQAVSRLRALGPDVTDHVPILLYLLSLRSEAHQLSADLRGEALRDAIHGALAALLRIQAEQEPFVLLLEDWHWADPASELSLRHILGLLPSLRALVLLSYRSHFQPEWAAERTALELGPLSPSETNQLIESLFPRAKLPEPWRQGISVRTAGNPLFIEEVCRGIAESGALERAGADPEALAASVWVPDTVDAVIRERIDRLDAQAIEVLRVASVLGNEFLLPILRHVVGDADLDACLASLRKADLVQPGATPGDAKCRFKHAITREVAYATLLRRDRRSLHDRAGRAIERYFAGERLEAHFEELAHHFSHGADTEKAIFYLERAGDKASASYSLEEARAHYGAALELLSALEATPERIDKRFELTFRWSQAGWYGPTAEQIDALEDARRLASRLGSRERELRCIYFIGWLRHTTGAPARAIECFERCIAMAAPDDHRLLSQLYCNLGENLALGTDYAKALEYMERGVALRKRAFPERWRTIGMAYALAWIALVHADRGDFARYDASMREALAIIEPLGHGSALASINQVRAIAEALRGDWEACLTYTSLGRQVANAIGAPPNLGMAICLEGWCLFMGRGDKQGIVALDAGLARMQAAGTELASSLYLACLGEALARSGDSLRAIDVARRAIGRADEGDRLGEAAGQRALGLALARAGGAEARAALDTAARLAQEKGSPREAALTELVRAEILRERGAGGEAARLAESARGAFGSMGMRWYEARASAVVDALRA